MRWFYAGILATAAVLAVMSWHWRTTEVANTTFYGVADTAETVVSAELPVEILRVRVVPGQPVRAGDTLADLASAELERNIAELRHTLNETRDARIAEDRGIRAQVAELEAQYRLNRSLLNGLRAGGSSGTGQPAEGASPLRAAIAGLKEMLSRETFSTDEMEAYLSLLEKERDKLTVVAAESGVIGSVHRRPGEKVKAFEPVLTLYTGSPLTVRGYLHESVHGLIENGQTVRVRSLASSYETDGEVVGVGRRIVEYPVRLRKRPDIQIWGREVVIRIPEGNGFLLGEKVMIDTRAGEPGPESRALLPGMTAHASPSPSASAEWELPDVEASGIVFLADIERFLVVSDDTPGKVPHVHVVGPAGALEGTALIQGLAEVNDMEAIALDGAGRLYVATSQSRNKSGRFPAARRLLIRAHREGRVLRLESSVSLHEALMAAARGNDADWAVWFRAAEETRSLDMEGLAPRDGGLLLGFKAPLRDGRAVILRVRDADALMAGTPLAPDDVTLWDAPALELPGGAACGVSDLLFHDGVLHVLGTAVRETADDGVADGGGGWWTLEAGEPARLVRALPRMKPEGIAYDPRAGVFRVALDEGSKKSGRVLALKPEPSPR